MLLYSSIPKHPFIHPFKFALPASTKNGSDGPIYLSCMSKKNPQTNLGTPSPPGGRYSPSFVRPTYLRYSGNSDAVFIIRLVQAEGVAPAANRSEIPHADERTDVVRRSAGASGKGIAAVAPTTPGSCQQRRFPLPIFSPTGDRTGQYSKKWTHLLVGILQTEEAMALADIRTLLGCDVAPFAF